MNLDKLLTTNTTKDIWEKRLENKLGQLAHGLKNRVKAQDTIGFIHKKEILVDKKITHTNFVCDYRPLKAEPNQVRMMV